MHVPAQKGTIRIIDADRATVPGYLFDPSAEPSEEMQERFNEVETLHGTMEGRQYRRSRPRSLADLVYEYDSDPNESRSEQRDTQDHYHSAWITPFQRYTWYREEGGQRKFYPDDTGKEDYYSQWQPGPKLEEGNWMEDYNYIRPSPTSLRDAAYREWYESTHPEPSCMAEAVTYWVNRRRQLERCQINHPRTYETFLRASGATEERSEPNSDTWDSGQLYRLHVIRAQAAATIPHDKVTEEDVDNHLIYTALSDRYRNISAPDIRPPDHPEHLHPEAIGLVAMTRAHPGPFEGCEREWRKHTTTNEEVHFYNKTVEKQQSPIGKQSDIRVIQRPSTRTTMSEEQWAQPKTIRNISAIVDTGAQVTTMPESAVSQMPNAHNHRDAPPGTAVKYGNGELETIERLVDIGHYEVQVTPDNCTATLISVDQIVEDGHTVSFSKTHTIIEDEEGRYSLRYPRAPDSREWTMPMTAMEDITRLRQKHPQSRMEA